MNSWWQLALAGLGGGGLAGIATSIIAGLWQRPKVKADVMSILTDAALKQVNELQERAERAEERLSEAERAADETRRKLRLASNELDDLLATVRSWRSAILAPSADLERLREMVRTDPMAPTNGRMVG
jgi:hypothetical protein